MDEETGEGEDRYLSTCIFNFSQIVRNVRISIQLIVNEVIPTFRRDLDGECALRSIAGQGSSGSINVELVSSYSVHIEAGTYGLVGSTGKGG